MARQRNELRPYQRRIAIEMLTAKSLGVFAGMGTGKTVTTLTAISDLLDFGDVNRVLIIAPLRVAQTVWRQEAAQWAHLNHMKISAILGTPKQRLAALNDETAQVFLVNRENLKWLFEMTENRKDMFDVLVIDESSMYKDGSTQGFKALRRRLGYFKRRFLLTGTPRPNSIADLWSQSYLLDDGKRLGTSFYRFRETFLRQKYPGSYEWLPRPGSDEQITDLLKSVTVRLDARDHLTMPGLLKLVHKVDLPDNARKMYRSMENDMFAKLEAGEVTAVNSAVVMGKCQQIANGAIFHNEEPGTNGSNAPVGWTDIHDAKIEALQEVLETIDAPTLVAYWYQHDLAKLRKAYPNAPVLGGGVKEADVIRIIDEWNAGKHPIVFIHPRSVGHGVNLQHGGRDIVFFSLLTSLEAHDQVIARIGPERRAGQSEPTRVHYIAAEDTVDNVLMSLLDRKAAGQNAMLQALREYAKEHGR